LDGEEDVGESPDALLGGNKKETLEVGSLQNKPSSFHYSLFSSSVSHLTFTFDFVTQPVFSVLQPQTEILLES
jgi:hypothetical protein